MGIADNLYHLGAYNRRDRGKVCCLLCCGDFSARDIKDQSRHKPDIAGDGVLAEHFKMFADDVNRRKKNPINSQVHKLPEDIQPLRKKHGKPPKKKLEEEPMHIKRNPGRPKGSKNKKTLEREALAQQQKHPELVKRKPGRPKGSKNKPITSAPETTQKRRRGRLPKNSNNSN